MVVVDAKDIRVAGNGPYVCRVRIQPKAQAAGLRRPHYG